MAQMNEQKVLAVVIATSLGLTGLCGGGVWLTSSKVKEEDALIETVDRGISEARAKIARIPRDEKEVIVLRENVKEYVKILPDQKDLENFTRTVNHFATQSGIVLRSMEPVRGTPGSERSSAFERVTYNLEMSGTLWQFMRFMNSFESYSRFMSVTSFQLATSGPGQGGEDEGERIHSIRMTVETYAYNAAGGDATQVTIPAYEQKREQYREDILRRKEDIRIERYVFRDARSRRDVFVDPRVDVSEMAGQGRGGLPFSAQSELIETARAEVADLEEKQAAAEREANFIRRFELNKEVQEGLARVAAKIEEVNEKELLSYRPFRLRFQVEVVQRHEALRKKHEMGAEGIRDTGLSLEELDGLKAAMEEFLELGELDQAVERFDLVRERLGAGETTPEREAVVAHIRSLHHKARVGQEFARKDIRVTGVVVVENGLSGAVINGQIVAEGDALEDELFVRRIGRESVEFLYRGVFIAKRL